MEQKHHFPARIVAQRAGQTPAIDGAFVFSAEISSDRLDAYYTHMAESTLRNFAQDAAAGVTFLDSHNSYQLGYGQSIDGVFEVSGGISRVVADFYTVPGIKFGSLQTYQSTDDFIRAVQTQLIRDVSVGFYGGDMICDICGNSLYDWRACPHWPGVEYPIGDQGNQTIMATAQVVDARLAEVSAVYDGATPGAMIRRAQEMSEAGMLEPETARRLEMQYRIKLPVSKRVTIAAVTPPERKSTMDELETIRALLSELNATGETVIDQVRWLVDENARLAPLADQGRQYRRDLIESTLAEGVRALGENFSEQTYRSILERAEVGQIKEIRDNFERQATLRFPGGRHTVNDEQPDTTNGQPRRAPAAAYKA